MIGLVRPDAGTVRVKNQTLDSSTAPALRLRMGYVIQEGGLFPHLTAWQNLTLQVGLLRWQPDKVKKRVAELRDLVRLPEEALARYPTQLSGGQRQRVSLMRALMLDPEILLLDEPLGALDPMIRAELQQDLRAIFQKLQKTVILVTHDLAEAIYFAQHIVLLHEGRLVQQGTFSDLWETPTEPFVTQFVNAQRALYGSGPVARP
jgi:osmoprotectant transport system ATP-binding protein